MSTDYCVVLTTTDSNENVDAIVETVLSQKLAACIQVVPIESHYFWQGRVTKDSEFLLLLKAKVADYNDLEAAIAAVHTYEVPEIVGLDIEAGSTEYLRWIASVTR